MRAARRALAAALLALAALPVTAEAATSDYGIAGGEASVSSVQAGAHPDFTIDLSLKRESDGSLPATTRHVIAELPPGLLANPTAVPACTAAQFAGTDINDNSNASGCPQSSQIGIAEIELFNEGGLTRFTMPVYNIAARYGQPARIGFFAGNFPVLIDARLRSESDYGATAAAENIGSLVPLVSATTRIWGVPADESHDPQRITTYEALNNSGVPDTPDGRRSAGIVPVPYMVNPTRCGVAQGVKFTAIPYGLPTLQSTLFAPLDPNLACGLLGFEPTLSVAPTTEQAESGSGLDVRLDFPTTGFEHPGLPADSAMMRAELTLPEGVTVNPSQAVGLGVCSQADFAREAFDSLPDEGCPESAKIGTVSATSPLLDETAEGGLFIARPRENPFGTLIALYMVLKIPERGVIVKLPIKVEPDPTTGQLISTVPDIPQLPAASFHLQFREGARSPLVTPPRCGTYVSEARFVPWSDPSRTVVTHPTFRITRGSSGGPCPAGALPFQPGFTARSLQLDGGRHSPFYMRLTRRDGDQDMTKFSAELPPGLVGKLAGVSQCSDASIAAAKAKTGIEELASPSCPPSAEIGHVLAGAGVGQVLTYAQGKLYLAGPYQGAPASVAAIVPAVAGPFDVGTVVTRVALRIDPKTAEVEVDGAASDPIPHILAGIPLKVRDIRVHTDRPNFTLNPTSCEPFAVRAEIWGGGDDVFSAADDAPVTASARFQAANCADLRFKPRLSLRLEGGTRRGAHPSFRAVFRPRPGDANTSRIQVTLPRSAFLDQAHIRTICTRVQFAAGEGNGAHCPKGSIYGHVRASTPLLDEPLSGPVILRSSNNNLPDLVAAVSGPPSLPVKFESAARIDSVGGGIRSTFDFFPDAPLTKAVLVMQGGKKGLIVNSRNLCLGPERNRARADFTAHNSRRHRFRPRVVAAKCGKTKRR